VADIRWLPELDARRTSEPQEIHLLVKLTVRRFKRGFIYLGNLPTVESSTKSSTKSSTN
jgi:hypothetical protein